jgi:hypothetical protein
MGIRYWQLWRRLQDPHTVGQLLSSSFPGVSSLRQIPSVPEVYVDPPDRCTWPCVVWQHVDWNDASCTAEGLREYYAANEAFSILTVMPVPHHLSPTPEHSLTLALAGEGTIWQLVGVHLVSALMRLACRMR